MPLTQDDAQDAGYRAWAENDPGQWTAAVQAAKAAGFDAAVLSHQAAVLDGVADRCVISRTHATFWRAVLTQP